MEHSALRKDRPLVTALFAALDLACDHSDTEIICRLSHLLDRLAAQDAAKRNARDAGASG